MSTQLNEKTYTYDDNKAPKDAVISSGYGDLNHEAIKSHLKHLGVPDEHAHAISDHLKTWDAEDSDKKGYDVMSKHGKITVHGRQDPDTGKNKFHVVSEEVMNKVHPDALHVKPVKVNGQTKYKVHAVGKNFSSGIKTGEHLSDTELDDFAEMGGKIKHIKEGRSLSEIMEEEVKRRGRPRKNPYVPAKKTSDEDGDDDYGPDTGPEADKHIQNQLKRAHDARDLKGGADVHFENGKKHFVKSEHAHKVLTALEKLKPADRSTAAAHIYKSHENFQAVHSMLK